MEAENKNYFNDEVQNNIKADFGFIEPHRTTTECKNPVFADQYLHRIAIMKDYHIGSKGDIDENGMPGWISKFVCTGCGKRFTINGNRGYFHPDSEAEKLESEISPETITINDLYVTSKQLFDCQDELKASQKELIDLRVELRVEKEKSKAIIKYLEENIERCKNTENHYKMVAKKRSSDVNWAMGQAYQNVLEFIKNQK